MHHFTDTIHDTTYDLGARGYAADNQDGTDAFLNQRSREDQSKDLDLMYNEFLKNDLDFSEHPNPFQGGHEDNFFEPMRFELDPLGRRTNQRYNDIFRPDQELEFDRITDNNQQLLGQFAENYENPETESLPKKSENMPIIPNFAHDVSSYNRLTDSQEYKLFPGGYQPTYQQPLQQEEVILVSRFVLD